MYCMLSGRAAHRGITSGRDAMFDVLRDARLPVATRRAYRKTAHSHHRFRRHPNLLKAGSQQVRAAGSEQVGVAAARFMSLVTTTFRQAHPQVQRQCLVAVPQEVPWCCVARR